jgi:hypothetical protein
MCIVMATIHSFPIQQQEQKRPSMLFSAADMLDNHFGYVLFEAIDIKKDPMLQMKQFHMFRYRPRINRMFASTNNLRKIHSFMLFVCIQFLFWLPIMNVDPDDTIDSPLTKTNSSLTELQLMHLAFISKYLRLFIFSA